LLAFIKNRFEELASGGVWVNRDVVGPENKDQLILMLVNDQDGRNDDYNKEISSQKDLADYLRGMSTAARFLRFKNDFRKKEGYSLEAEPVIIENTAYWKLTLKDACEFMSRKDYVDNWESEMHETFCFWDFQEWRTQLGTSGFHVLPESHAYTNEWIVQNRLVGKVSLYNQTSDGIESLPYPVTNMLMIAEKI